MNILESAKNSDIDVCWNILADGRSFQREQGFVQWTDDYPNRDTVENDILSKKGYILKVDGTIAGYMCIDFSGEPAYESIGGSWRSEKNYAVIHRMAFRKTSVEKGSQGPRFLWQKNCVLSKAWTTSGSIPVFPIKGCSISWRKTDLNIAV